MGQCKSKDTVVLQRVSSGSVDNRVSPQRHPNGSTPADRKQHTNGLTAAPLQHANGPTTKLALNHQTPTATQHHQLSNGPTRTSLENSEAAKNVFQSNGRGNSILCRSEVASKVTREGSSGPSHSSIQGPEERTRLVDAQRNTPTVTTDNGVELTGHSEETVTSELQQKGSIRVQEQCNNGTASPRGDSSSIDCEGNSSKVDCNGDSSNMDSKGNSRDQPAHPQYEEEATKDALSKEMGLEFPQMEDGLPAFMEIRDRFGNPIFFKHGGDVLLFPSPLIADARVRLAEIKETELHHDDIIIAGFMKAGNHWVQQIVRMLVQNSVDYKPNTLAFEVFEYIPDHLIPPPHHGRVFFTHLRCHHLPKQVWQRRVKVIHLVRNPKDTFVSLFCHLNKMNGTMGYAGTWSHFFHTMLEMGFYHGDWFDHTLDWESEIASHPDHPIFVLHYEDLCGDPVGLVQKLNTFLGLGRGEGLCRSITSVCQVDSMRQREEELLRKLDIFTKDSPGIYRKGKVGDWKNWFTPEQNRLFDAVYKRRMKNSKRVFQFE